MMALPKEKAAIIKFHIILKIQVNAFEYGTDSGSTTIGISLLWALLLLGMEDDDAIVRCCTTR
jgi:hypothetical protein